MAAGPPVPSLVRERAAWAGARLLVGVDEAGRGPLAGPVVAAAVVFPPGREPPEGVRDSKVLSPGQRAALAPRLLGAALAVGVGAGSVAEIDRLNIRVATALAMRRAILRALRTIERSSRAPGVEVLIDGLPLPELRLEHQALVDGDALCYSVAAAGVIAKQFRDRLMGRLAGRHPGYGWASNAGYGTPEHLASLAALGPTPHHRRSFAPVSQLALFR